MIYAMIFLPLPHKSPRFVILLQRFAVSSIIMMLWHSEVDIFGAGDWKIVSNKLSHNIIKEAPFC